MILERVAERKKIEFRQKLNAIDHELSEWCEISAEKQPFEKHNSQIRAIRAHLEPWNKAISTRLDQYENKDADVFLGKCRNAEKLILSEHRIWDYFRSKFIQRKNESFNSFLKVADEFAWACYKPIQEATKSELKEPPLVFFNGGMSPFSVSRERTFKAEQVPGEDLSAVISNEEINKLPISVVGIPWDQINQLADASVLGHEIGHIVENDFKLTEDLRKLLDEALIEADAESRKEAWHSWLAEIFADIYGCLATGPAYAATLFDYLANEEFEISNQKKESPEWTSYPTDFLRMKIIVKILDEMSFTNMTSDYVEIVSCYSSKMPEDFVRDIDFIVPRLLNGKYDNLNNKSIREIFCFTPEEQIQVEETVDQIRGNKPAEGGNPKMTAEIETKNIRILIAATRSSYEKSPDEHSKFGYDEVVLNHVEKRVIEKGTRSGYVPTTSDDKLKKYLEIGENSIEQIIEQLAF